MEPGGDGRPVGVDVAAGTRCQGERLRVSEGVSPKASR